MMPVSPVMGGSEPIETVYAKDQAEYLPLPSVVLDQPNRPVITRWRLDTDERVKVIFGGDIVLTLLTFGHPLQPVHLQVCSSNEDPDLEHTK